MTVLILVSGQDNMNCVFAGSKRVALWDANLTAALEAEDAFGWA